MQEKYWNQMTQYKFALCYMDEQIERSVVINRTIIVMCAAFSSVSIAAWTKWTHLAFLWGLLIAASQVLSAINEFLPYKNRIKELDGLKNSSSHIYIEMEHDWFNVSGGLLSDEEINDKCFRYAEKWDSIDGSFLKDDSIHLNRKCVARAEKKKNIYFERVFNGGYKNES